MSPTPPTAPTPPCAGDLLLQRRPGSASVWLHLGSFGPSAGHRCAGRHRPAPLPLVDNADSLLDSTDMVFVDAVGSRSFYLRPSLPTAVPSGACADAALFRDAIRRWCRSTPPGLALLPVRRSYGGPRTGRCWRDRLQEPGAWPAGPGPCSRRRWTYNSNCGFTGGQTTSRARRYLPSYAATAACTV